MNKKSKTSVNGVKKKLMGAVCMLLVASIMMISATYAWFTLSTAPEITGITTSVGANGNLEMALLNGSLAGKTPNDTAADLKNIKSAVGDSMVNKGVKDANITWGNLVDLSDPSYGTGSFVLNPARLNVTGNKINDAGLMTPTYGADGRVAELLANTVTGVYDDAANTKAFVASDNKGVRAIGVAAAMSDGTLAIRNAAAQISSLTSMSRSGVQNAINANGSTLASLAIKFQDNADYKLTDTERTALNAIVTSINSAKANVKLAIEYAMMAYALSTDANASKDVSTYDLTDAGEKLTAAKTAYEAIPELTAVDAAISAADVKTLIGKIMDTANSTINGTKISEARNPDKVSEMANAVLKDGGVKVIIPADSTCALAKVAVACGNISANVTIESLSVSSVKLDNVKATLSTSAADAAALTTVGNAVSGLTAADKNTTTGDTKITDVYGFGVDMAFRTNASGSNLMLQVDEAQRIYGDGTDVSTQGGGSYMEFTKGDLTDDQFKNLLGAIRVVFSDYTNQTIIAVAALDTSKWTANQTTFKAPLKMVDYTISDAGVMTITGKAKVDNTIMTLTQGNAAALTVTTYLDGDKVDNSMVSATASRSMTGSMNLQFASSADLKPMDYTPLHTVDSSTKYTAVANGTPVTIGDANYTVASANVYKSGSKYYVKSDGDVYTEITAQNVGTYTSDFTPTGG